MAQNLPAEAQPPKQHWWTSPYFIGAASGFLVWLLQFGISKLDNAENRKTEHYGSILTTKIALYTKLESLSNAMFNDLRLLNKFVRLKRKGTVTAFDVDRKIRQQFEKFYIARVNFVTAHYENYMLQSHPVTNAYENLISYTSDELNEVNGRLPNSCLGFADSTGEFIDFDVSTEIGSDGFIQKAFEYWITYVKVLGNELKDNDINLQVDSVRIEEDSVGDMVPRSTSRFPNGTR